MTAINREWIAFEQSLIKLNASPDSETHDINWHGVQLALTRVSLEIGNLQDMTVLTFLGEEGQVLEMQSTIETIYKDEYARLVEERYKLDAAK